jgi:uncharacterized metal-binding protein YceD (DUF177 family)
MEKKGLNYFSIPFKGLKNGSHHFQFEVRSDLFQYFENQDYKEVFIDVGFFLFKQDNVSTMEFDVAGYIGTNCDRCTASIKLPIEGKFTFLLKLGEEQNSTEEVVFINPETSVYSVAEIIYECIILSIPIIKVYDCESEEKLPCNEAILQKLEDIDDNKSGSPMWDALKNIDLNDN